MNRLARSIVGGTIFFVLAASLGVALGFLGCLVRGLDFSFSHALFIEAKGGAVAGLAMAIVFFIGEPRPRKLH